MDRAETKINVAFTALNKYNLHMLYLIVMQKNSVLRRDHTAAENNLGKYTSYSGKVKDIIWKEIIFQ